MSNWENNTEPGHLHSAYTIIGTVVIHKTKLSNGRGGVYVYDTTTRRTVGKLTNSHRAVDLIAHRFVDQAKQAFASLVTGRGWGRDDASPSLYRPQPDWRNLA